MIVPPAGGKSPSPRVVPETVSLRDLPATVLDLLDLEAGSPFPGASLARLWGHPASGASVDPPASGPSPALSEVVPIDPLNPDPSEMVKPHWPLAAVNQGGWTYIRREGDVHEELFHLREDAKEMHNLAGDRAMAPILERMRKALSRLTGGPLTPQRFSR